ncbi:unnamed protein product [Mytilus coruscus]|uniref:Mab-21-like HhH/H2TH-like domain-containing protein n=1 Tax=Mytilus coruscus TaxID=42192 RepID=A0A6J8B8L6_MYTCO|nr:unnamed protein product [Mytilus coruscus]
MLIRTLRKTVGSEIDIRKRQRLFIIQDMFANACDSGYTKISSGSLAEGLDLPGSDIDINNIKHPIHRTTLVMETDIDHPGVTKLRFKAVGVRASISVNCQCRPGTCNGEWLYLGPNKFLNEYMKQNFGKPLSLHGPCLSNRGNTLDIAFCLQSKYLPQNAIPWAFRRRWQWPPNFVIDRIINFGCLLVPIGPKTIRDNDVLWRLSFSVAEKILVHSFNFPQLLCYGLLKLMLKCIVNTQNEVKDLLCSYFLKTALFWVSEEVDIEIFHLSKIYYCFSLCLDKIISWVNNCYCPNYFIPEHNMFLGKINQRNNKILLCVLESIKSGGMKGLINNLFAPHKENQCLSYTYNESSFIMLDFLLYKILDHSGSMTSFSSGISSYYKGLVIADSLLIRCRVLTELIINTRRTTAGGKRTYHPYSTCFMSDCFRFLCYHHLGDISNRRHQLRDLHLKGNAGPFTPETSLADSLTILGACNEISGYKDAAYQCYVKSLQVMKCKCSTAEIRKLKLFDI